MSRPIIVRIDRVTAVAAGFINGITLSINAGEYLP